MNKLNYYVIDIQAFYTPEFTPKELSIMSNDGYIHHYLLTSLKAWNKLPVKSKKQNFHLSHFHHGIRYDDGLMDFSELPRILQNLKADRIYVKGHQKQEFLKTIIDNILIINLENFENCPTLVKTEDTCIYHLVNDVKKYVCSFKNVQLLSNFVEKYIISK